MINNVSKRKNLKVDRYELSDQNNKVTQSDQQQKINQKYSKVKVNSSYCIDQELQKCKGELIPFTNIPIMHFKAMLKKDFILWKRNFKRSLFEILLPVAIFAVISCIRYSIKPSLGQRQYLDRFVAHFNPLPRTKSLILTENSTFSELEYFQDLVESVAEDFNDVAPFADFQSKKAGTTYLGAMLSQWTMDNCVESDINGPRKKWAVVGNPKIGGKDFLSRVVDEIRNIVYIRTHATLEATGSLGDEVRKLIPNFPRGGASQWWHLDQEPLIFETEEDLLRHLTSDSYEKVKDGSGICFGFRGTDNIDKEKDGEPTAIDFKMYVEHTDGRCPSQGHRSNYTSQLTVCNTKNPVIDKFQRDPDLHCGEQYVRQGYASIQNIVANAALRVLTKNDKARINISLEPIPSLPTKKDDFQNVIIAIYSYISILIYILPMYSFILRLQEEKQSGIKKHLEILGLSFYAQILALWVSYSIQITIVSAAIFITMWIGGLFQKSMNNNPFLLFFFHWIQGMSNFGFIIMMSALLPRNMAPKIAAKWGTLIYFGSTFGDFIIQKPAVDESKKVILSLIFPNLATARASRSLCLFEYSGGGTGLNFSDTLWIEYHNYRIITYFFVMIYAFVLYSIVGLLFEKYGSIPEIINNFMRLFISNKQKYDELQEQAQGQGKQSFNNQFFEDVSQYSFDHYEEKNEQMLIIQNLTKTFKQSLGQSQVIQEIHPKYFTAVDNLSLNLQKNEIFCLLGHNGAGKTTTISMLTGMLEASSGKVSCFGRTLIDNDLNQIKLNQDIEYIRKIMGICPQHDLLFEQLTVKENLDVYCDFKGVDPNLKKLKIENIMRDIGLETHSNKMAKNLSGGNRRKLSVAIALIADSQLVLLDEPASGMDLTAKRKLWNMLQEYKKDRIIILTTHNMEEADVLSDKIGIMSQGQIVCLGSSAYLKKQFSYGFKLVMQIKESSSKADDIKNYIYTHLGPNVKQISNKNLCELVFLVSEDQGKNFTDFFKKFDKYTEQFDIISFNLTTASLDDVFQQISSPYFIKTEKSPIKPSQVLIQNQHDNELHLNKMSQVSDKIDEFRKNQSLVSLIGVQFSALLTRKAQSYKRSLKSMIFEIMVPVILVAVGFTFGSLKFENEGPIREISADLYPARQRILVNQHLGVLNNLNDMDDEDFNDEDQMNLNKNLRQSQNLKPHEIMKYFQKYSENRYNIEYLDTQKATDSERQKFLDYHIPDQSQNCVNIGSEQFCYEKYIQPLSEEEDIWYSGTYQLYPYNVFKTHSYNTRKFNESKFQENHSNENLADVYPVRFASYYIYQADNKTKNFKVSIFLNLTSSEVVPTFPLLMYDAILKAASGKPDLKFTFAHQPFPKHPNNRQQEFSDGAPGIFVCFVVGIALALIPGSIVSRIVGEKEKGLYHMQVVSGVDLSAYWISNFVFDLIMSYIPCISICILMYWFNLGYNHVWKTLFLLPWAVIPYTYIFSYLFEKEITAQTFTIYKHFLLSGIAGMIVFALRMVDQTALWGDRILWIMRCICPTFQICNAIVYASNTGLLVQRRHSTINDYYSRLFTGKEASWPVKLTYNALEIQNIGGDLVSLAIQSLIWWMLFIFIEKLPRGYFETMFANKQKITDKIKCNMLQLDEDVLQEAERVLQEGKQSKVCVNQFCKYYFVPFSDPVLAVENASFAVNKGECFALLGVNGAGKTTTFKSLTNMVLPSHGLVTINGNDVASNFNRIRHLIGYCPQHDALFNGVTVYEHLKFYAVLKGLPYSMQDKLIQEAIQKLGIEKYVDKQADQLSGGNKRKLQVAIAILGNPQIILLDEPSAGMDPASKRFMWQVLSGITSGNQNDTCIILTTHSMEEAEALSSKMGIMVQGGIFSCFGSPQHIKNKFGNCYEIQMKLKKLKKTDFQKYLSKIKNFEEYDEKSLQFFINISIEESLLGQEHQQNFETSFVQAKYPNNSQLVKTIKDIKVLPLEYFTYLNFYKMRHQMISQFVINFQEVDLLESYGDQYFRIRVPKNDKSIGFIYGLIENEKIKNNFIEDYSVNPTTLEMIFQFFAEKGKLDREIGKIEDKLEYKFNGTQVSYRLSNSDSKKIQISINNKYITQTNEVSLDKTI